MCVWWGGGLFGPPPVPIPPTLGGLGRKKAFGFVASFLLQQRGLCILVVASLFKYSYAIAYMYIYLYAQTLTCPNVFESLHAGRNHFFQEMVVSPTFFWYHTNPGWAGGRVRMLSGSSPGHIQLQGLLCFNLGFAKLSDFSIMFC